jgi:hypothetical protein
MHRPFGKIFKDTEFQKGLTINVFTKICSKSKNEKATVTSDGSLKRLPYVNWKGYNDSTSKMTDILCSESVCQQISLTFQWFKLCSGYCNVRLRRLMWWVTEKPMMMSDGSLKRLPRRQTKKAMTVGQWKCYNHIVAYVFTELQNELLPTTGEDIKTCHEGRSIYTRRTQTMGSKEPEPWSPRWVR